MVTMKDVGKAAGVSIATVSRVLAGAPSVSKETKERVQAAIDELQYCSNGLAKGLRQRQTNLVAVIMEDMENPFFVDALRGVEDVLSTNDYIPMFFNVDGDESAESSVWAVIRSLDVCGVILVVNDSRLCADQDALSNTEVALICLNPDGIPPEIGADAVVPDFDRTGGLVVEAFLRAGGRDFVYIPEKNVAGPPENPMYAAFGRAAEGKAHSLQYWPLAAGERGRRQLGELIENRRPDSIFVHDAMQAADLLRMLASLGIAVPAEMSVICFENTILARASSPALTVVGPNGYQMGMVGAQCLVERIQSVERPAGTTKIQPRLIQRDSIKWEK